MSTAHYDELDDPNRAQFSVFAFFNDDHYEPVIRWVNMYRAQDEVKRVLANEMNRMVTKRLIITDGGDHCVFEWTRGKGVTFPTPEQVKAANYDQDDTDPEAAGASAD